MAETLLDDEEEVRVLLRTQNLETETEIEDENEDWEEDWSHLEWESVVSLIERVRNSLPDSNCDVITDYDSSYYLTEAFCEMSEDQGDPRDLSFDDLDNYLYDSGCGMGDFSSVESLANSAADKLVEDMYWEYRDEILIYYTLWYYRTQWGDYIPTELSAQIRNYSWSYIDQLSECEDIVDEFAEEHPDFELWVPDD